MLIREIRALFCPLGKECLNYSFLFPNDDWRVTDFPCSFPVLELGGGDHGHDMTRAC
jgi:hypothetical protein